MSKITANEMARKAQVHPKLFREVLLDENFEWHIRNTRWTVETGGEEHRAMQRVLNKISTLRNPPIGNPRPKRK